MCNQIIIFFTILQLLRKKADMQRAIYAEYPAPRRRTSRIFSLSFPAANEQHGCLGCILPTPNAPGQRVFLRCAASFFLAIRQDSCEKMSCSTQKSLAAGHIMSVQIHPSWKGKSADAFAPDDACVHHRARFGFCMDFTGGTRFCCMQAKCSPHQAAQDRCSQYTAVTAATATDAPAS